jgi:hypothetical protein
MSTLVSSDSFSISENDYEQKFKMIPIKGDGHCQFRAVCHDPRVETLMQQANVDTNSDIDMIKWLRDEVVKVIALNKGKYSNSIAGADATNIYEYMKNISWKAPTLKFLQQRKLPLSKDELNGATDFQKIYYFSICPGIRRGVNQTKLEALQEYLFPEVPPSAWGDEITASVMHDVIKLPIYIYNHELPETGGRYFYEHLSDIQKQQPPVLLCYYGKNHYDTLEYKQSPAGDVSSGVNRAANAQDQADPR